MNVTKKFSPTRFLHPIDDLDIRASDKNYSETEKKFRCQLAAAHRLVDIYGWAEGIYNHITLRLPGNEDHFLIKPFGLLFHEITASSFLKVDADGNILDPGSTNFSLNRRAFCLHSAAHQARRDMQVVLHMHMPEVIAVSCTKDGFVPVCQEGMAIGAAPPLEFNGVMADPKERDRITNALSKNNALLLRNHGFIILGSTIPDAMLKAYFFLYNIKAQLHLISTDCVITPDPDAARRTYEVLNRGEKTEINNLFITNGTNGINGHANTDITWGFGGMDWEANMRMLDSMGLKTGHKYRLNVWRDQNH